MVPTFHVDGAYQTYSVLARLADGLYPGADFFPYLGIGPNLVLYPLFWLGGATPVSSEFAAHFAVIVFAQIAVIVVLRLVVRIRLWIAFAVASLIPLLTVIELSPGWEFATTGLDFGFYNFLSTLDPGHSLRPIRSAAPWLLASVFLLTQHSGLRSKTIALGAASGAIAAVWSNDYAFISAALFLVFLILLGEFRDLRSQTRVFFAFVAGFLAVGSAVTAGSLFDLLHYNWVDVRGDQSWYFGPYLADSKITDIADLFVVFTDLQITLATFLLATLIVAAAYKRDRRLLLLSYVGTSMLGGGLVAVVGGHLSFDYFNAFKSWAFLVFVALIVRGFAILIRGRFGLKVAGPRSRLISWVSTSLLLMLSSLFLADQYAAFTNSVREVGSDPSYLYSQKLGGYLPSEWAAYLEAIDELRGPIVEEYSGIASALAGPNEALRVDSVIHALGAERKEYAANLKSGVGAVITSSPDIAPWFWWNVSTNWWFYGILFREWDVTSRSPQTIIWEKLPGTALKITEVHCRVSPDGKELLFEAPSTGIVEITVRYVTDDSRSSFMMVENRLNEPFGPLGFVPLNPHDKSQSFPVGVPYHGWQALRVIDSSGEENPGSKVSECEVRTIPTGHLVDLVPELAGDSKPSNGPIDFTDENWQNGVRRGEPAFIVPNTWANRSSLQAGTRLDFEDGFTRTITKTASNHAYLEVYVSGPAISPSLSTWRNEAEVGR